jgi:hypothetical protein
MSKNILIKITLSTISEIIDSTFFNNKIQIAIKILKIMVHEILIILYSNCDIQTQIYFWMFFLKYDESMD